MAPFLSRAIFRNLQKKRGSGILVVCPPVHGRAANPGAGGGPRRAAAASGPLAPGACSRRRCSRTRDRGLRSPQQSGDCAVGLKRCGKFARKCEVHKTPPLRPRRPAFTDFGRPRPSARSLGTVRVRQAAARPWSPSARAARARSAHSTAQWKWNSRGPRGDGGSPERG